MLRKIFKYLFPLFGFDERTRVKRSLYFILPVSAAVSMLYGLFFIFQHPGDARKWVIFSVILISLASWWLAQMNYLRTSALLFVISLWLIMFWSIIYSGGMASVGQGGFLLLIFIAGLLLGGRYAFFVLLISLAGTTWVVYAETHGQLPLSAQQKPIDLWLVFAMYLIIGWVLLSLTMRNLRMALTKASQELEERRQAEAVLSEQAQYLAALHETTLEIVNRLDLNSLLESILVRAESLAETRHGYIDLVLPGQKSFRKHLGHGVFEPFVNTIIPIGRGITSDVLETGKTIVVDDYNTWQKKHDIYSDQGFYATVGIPLIAQSRVIGVLGLAYDAPGFLFVPKLVEQLTKLAELATLVLNNASLYQAAQDELTERARAEHALRQSQECLNLALSAAQMGVWDWEIGQEQINWSDRVYEILGIEKSTFKNNLDGFIQLIHPDDRHMVRQTIENCWNGITSDYQLEYRILLESGEARWIETQGKIYQDEHEQPAQMAGTITNVTDRKLNEQAVLLANNSLRSHTERLEERSGLLQLGAEVARAATAILDPRMLSQQVVDMVQKQFNLYYTGLFLIEDDPNWAILRAATGKAGQEMLNAGHRLEVGGASMIGWCIANCKPRIALDVGEDAVRFSNPLLPGTRSELALPLVSRGEVLGALTIQSDKPTTFTQENIVSFETMADLLANAILNARLYDQLQRELDERKRAEDKIRQLNIELESRVRRRTAALQASEEKFRALAENNPLQIARYDRDGRYLYVNHLGTQGKLSPSNVLGKTLREVFGSHHPAIDFAEQKIRQVFDTGQPLKTEYELTDFAGLWSLAPEFDPQGNIVSVISTTLDITERKKTEEELRQRSAELQAANRELEAFSYSVSHDLRAPLRAIDGFTHILIGDFADQLSSDGIALLKRTRQAAQNMGQLIDDLLRLSRITRVELRRQSIDLKTLAAEICEQLKESEPERDVKIMINRGLKSRGDERLLRVALENLLNNAWKFTSKTPDATIKIGKISKNGKSTFYVSDNGVGFNMNYVDKLFGPFQRLHTIEEFPGTGIGLAIVKRIIHKHGGEIWPESEPGKGTTFYFTLE
jgi:PAS domain S-box-containing protein